MSTNTTIWTGAWGRIGGRKLESKRRDKEVGALLHGLELRGHETALDIGVGPGLVSLALAEQLGEGQVIGLDLSPDMLARLMANAEARGLAARLRSLEADAVDSGLPEASVDLAVSNMLLHELLDLDALTRELFRVLRPGGQVRLRDFRRMLLSRVMVRIFHGTEVVGPLTGTQLEGSLRRAGFVEVRVTRDGLAQIGSGRKPA